MHEKEICVLMATYNGEKYIDKQLESILNSTIQTNILVSDDNSNDSTLNKIKEYPSDRINILSNAKKGSSSENFIFLIKNIPNDYFDKYKYFAFSDQDDYFDENHYLNSIDLLEANNADLCGASVISINDETNKENYINYALKEKKYSHFFEGLSPGFTFVFTSKLIKLLKNRLETIEIPVVFWHDWLLYAFAKENGFKTVVKNNNDIYYRQHLGNVTGSRNSIKGIFYRLKNVMNSFYPNEIILISVAVMRLSNKNNPVVKLLKNDLSKFEIIKLVLNSRRRLFDRFACIIAVCNICLNRKRYNHQYKEYIC